MKVYLAGPINGCTDEECNDWRQYVIDHYKGECLNPMVRDYRGREAECFEEIVENDKKDITECETVLVMYEKPSVGTSMEILYAHDRDKPVILICRKDAVISPWLRYHSSTILHTLDEAISYLNDLRTSA